MSKYTHMSLEERAIIEQGLKKGHSFKAIAVELSRNCSTISKEIRRHIVTKQTGSFGRSFNCCRNRRACRESYLCEKPDCKHDYCRFCRFCNHICPQFEREDCQKLKAPPYVCNACSSTNNCTLEKRIYSAKKAQIAYELLRREAREGIALDEEELLRLDRLISPLLLKGQSIHHICITHQDEIMRDEKTIYNYVDAGLFQAKNLDLARKVRRRPRKKASSNLKVDKACRVSRTYENFLAYLEKYPDTPIVQMDTVEGRKGGKVLLTIHFTQQQFMLAFLRAHNTSQSVIDIFNSLYELLGREVFCQLFSLCLTDNGSEFSNPAALEFDQDGRRRTYVFYCDPYSAWQKGALENNHEFIRKIIPKGKSFDALTQDDVTLMMNHINSYARKKLNDRSPHQSFNFFFGHDILNKLGAVLIPTDEITLHPDLIKK